MLRLALLATAVVGSLIALKWLPLPYVWISVLWLVVLAHAARTATTSLRKALWFNVGVAVLTFGCLEAYLWTSKSSGDRRQDIRVTYDPGYYARHDILGYGPNASLTASSRQFRDAELVRETEYTIGANGLRAAPPQDAGAGDDCIAFFGGSFTMGEGVADHEAMPYRVGIKTGGRFRTYNFGFHGYGPHQMLAALEHGLVAEILDCRPRYAVYQAIYEHLARAAGLVSWDPHGPRYRLEPDGSVVYSGHFDDRAFVTRTARSLLDKSYVMKRVFPKRRKIRRSDIPLFVGIVARARTLFETAYPGSEFHMLMWNRNNPLMPELLSALDEAGVRVHLMTEILPDLHHPERYKQYRLVPDDGHPNAHAHDLIADYVVANIVGG